MIGNSIHLHRSQIASSFLSNTGISLHNRIIQNFGINEIIFELYKFLALILRHKPAAAGITLDVNGWTDVNAIITKLNNRCNFNEISLDTIQDLVSSDDKNRYELSDDLSKIRARQGHSIQNIDLQLEPQTPPETLYHGTVQKFIQNPLALKILKGEFKEGDTVEVDIDNTNDFVFRKK